MGEELTILSNGHALLSVARLNTHFRSRGIRRRVLGGEYVLRL